MGLCGNDIVFGGDITLKKLLFWLRYDEFNNLNHLFFPSIT